MADDAGLDEQVAVKLGWMKCEPHVMTLSTDDPRCYSSYTINWKSKDGKRGVKTLPPYSTSIEAAWDVLEHVRKLGYKAYLFESEVIANGWSCEFTYGEGNIPIQHADTAPLAICRAFLKLP